MASPRHLSKKHLKKVEEYFSNKNVLCVMQEMVLNLKEIQPSDTKSGCLKQLGSTKIHIYDFVCGRYHKKCTHISQLQRRVKQLGPFPKKKAKACSLKALLQVIW